MVLVVINNQLKNRSKYYVNNGALK